MYWCACLVKILEGELRGGIAIKLKGEIPISVAQDPVGPEQYVCVCASTDRA